MGGSPKALGYFYFILGSLFVYIAIQFNNETGWSLFTFVAIAIAAIDYMISIQHFLKARELKEKK